MSLNFYRIKAAQLTAAFLFLLHNHSNAELFDLTYSEPPVTTTLCKFSYAGTNDASTALAFAFHNNVVKGLLRQNTDRVRNYGFQFTDNGVDINCTASASYSYKRDQKVADEDGNETWGNTQEFFGSLRQLGTKEQGNSCDDGTELRKHTFTHIDDEQKIRCFDPLDLVQRDSCPDSSSAGDFILPDNGTGALNVCREKEDGSLCGYDYVKSSDNQWFYKADFEHNCYETPSLRYEDSDQNPLDDIDPNNAQCQVIGSGVSESKFCPANENAVCPNGLCPEGCGSFDVGEGQVFGCLSQLAENLCDVDGDGVPDEDCLNISEPDPDPDPDPDNGECDPFTEVCDEDPPPTCDPTVQDCTAVDMSGVESRLTQVSDLLRGNNQKLDRNNQSLQGIKQAVEENTGVLSDVRDSVESIDDELSNSENVTFSDVEPSLGLVSFYSPEYPNGFQDVFSKVEPAYSQTEFFDYIRSWEVTVSGAYTYPQLCINVLVNFGCHTIELDGRIWAFIRVLMLVSCAFLCRRLVLGG